jgi:hypothetical protein
MNDGPSHLNALLPQRGGSPIEIDLINRKGKMLERPFTFVLLQDYHSSRTPHAQKNPVPFLITEADFEAEDIPIEGFGPSKILNTDRDLIHATKRQHIFTHSLFFS